MKLFISITSALAVISAVTTGFRLCAADSPSAKPDKTEAARPAYLNVNVPQFEKLRRGSETVVLDVRTPREYAAGHVPGAINIDVNAPDFEKKVAALDKTKTYLVHCAAGVRSVKACKKLSAVKFPHLYNLVGGFRLWEKAGHRAER